MNEFTISEAAFEFTVEKMQQTIRRQLIAIIALVILFAVTIGGMVFAFIKYEARFDTEYCEVKADSGNAYYGYVGEDGDIRYGDNQS